MKQITIGILGVLLIVGSMQVILAVRGGPSAGPDDGGATGSSGTPPPLLGRDQWRADDCHALSLVWTPPLDMLQKVVGPQWEPIAGPVPGRGLFVLFAYHCDGHVLNGIARSASDAGAVIVRIADPDDTRNITEASGWSAVPEWVGDPTITKMVARHGFVVAPGSTSVAFDETPLGLQATLTYRTDAGEITATAALATTAETRDVYGALVSTHAERFGVFEGPETMTRHATGTALVQSTGDTWVSRLGLEPVPFAVALDRDFQWDFTFWSDPVR